MEYNFKEMEKKWQKYWLDNKTFATNIESEKPKFYALDMFPYPSGSGLHVGHPKGYTATDIISRFKRLKGFEVMHPMGWDAFGLPAEQYALKTGNHPAGFTQTNIDTFRKQIQSLGFSYDWDREINTTDPEYYRWSQWIFLKLYEHGLAEVQEVPVNYCQECGAVLANEEVTNGLCERGHGVIQLPMRQWVLKITKYADRLLDDLNTLDWPESLKDMQRNWIGRSEGAVISFGENNKSIEVFTTKPYTIYGVAAIVIAVDHENLDEYVTEDNKDIVDKFKTSTLNKTDLERNELNKDKSGVFTGSYVINPINNKEVPVYIGDYVLKTFGTGAVMCVPFHDERDYDFGKKYNLEFIQVLEGDNTKVIINDGPLMNSEILNGLDVISANNKILEIIETNAYGKKEVRFKLRDWLFSRQRYWGEPFPIVYDKDGKIIALDETELPIKLPHLDKIEPGNDGSSPLFNATDWLTFEYQGEMVTRETNTMPQWAGSCWYYIRYLDPNNKQQLIDFDIAKKWLPVDLYIGGAEHAVLHLLYARFWFKFLFDIGQVPVNEPFQKLFNQGMIQGPDGQKMSKSKGNVVNPDDIVKSHGADTLRLYEMFMGPLDASVPWTEEGLDGSKRFIDRIWRLYSTLEFVDNCDEMEILINKTIKKVENDIETLSFNTAISQLMIFVNTATKIKKMTREQALKFNIIIYPFIPHVSEEINNKILNNDNLVNELSWPIIDDSKLVEESIEIIIQVNGKIKAKKIIPVDLSKEELRKISIGEIENLIGDKKIIKEIIVVNKLVNFIIK